MVTAIPTVSDIFESYLMRCLGHGIRSVADSEGTAVIDPMLPLPARDLPTNAETISAAIGIFWLAGPVHTNRIPASKASYHVVV